MNPPLEVFIKAAITKKNTFVFEGFSPMHYAKKNELNFQLPRRASDGKMYFLVLVIKFPY